MWLSTRSPTSHNEPSPSAEDDHRPALGGPARFGLDQLEEGGRR